MRPILALVLATLASSLRVPQTRVETPTRRAALTALAAAASLPILHADAAPSFDKGALDLKPREERKKLKPDGFGGYIERDAPVESIPGRILNPRDDETAIFDTWNELMPYIYELHVCAQARVLIHILFTVFRLCTWLMCCISYYAPFR